MSKWCLAVARRRYLSLAVAKNSAKSWHNSGHSNKLIDMDKLVMTQWSGDGGQDTRVTLGLT